MIDYYRTKRFKEAAAHGFNVFPLREGAKVPNGPWKKFIDHSASPMEIEDWDNSKYNVGVICGAPSNIVVVDIDSDQAQAVYDSMCLDLTPCVKTAKGKHYYFRHPGSPVKNSVRLLDTELDIPLPSLEVQKRIAGILDQADALRRLRARALEKLSTLGQAVLNKALSGCGECASVGFEDIADMQVGYPFKSDEYVNSDDAIRLCRGANVLPDTIDWSNAVKYPQASLNGLEKFSLQEKDVVIAMDRPWISTGFKAAAIKRDDLPSFLVQRVARLRAKKAEDAAFLKAIVQSQEFQKHCRPTETTVPHISPLEIKSFRFRLPDAKTRTVLNQLMGNVASQSITYSRALNHAEALFASLQSAAFQGEL